MESALLVEGAIAPGVIPDENKVAALAKCAHGECQCLVNSEERYCSEYCSASARGERTAGAHERGCNCGHEECASAW